MKRPPACGEGMETVTSLFMLIISALLIFSVLSQADMGMDNESDLFEFRTYQAQSLGETLILYFNNYAEVPIINDFPNNQSEGTFFWNGNSFFNLTYGNFSDGECIEEVLKMTPDGLSTFVSIGIPGSIIPDINGEFITWSHTMSHGLRFVLYLSLHIGSIEIPGWSG
jgi:hypothetical protein